MKKIKIALSIVLAYSVGEFITQYRLTESGSLKEFTKLYIEESKTGFKEAQAAGELLFRRGTHKTGVQRLKILVRS